MRRSRLLVAFLLGATLFGALPGTASGSGTGEAPEAQDWVGTTTQGQPTLLAIGRTTQRVIRYLDIGFILTCGDGQEIGFGVGFIGFDVPIVGGYAAFDFVFLTDAFHWTGQFKGEYAKGTARFVLAALTGDEEAQLCLSGEQGWEAAPAGAGPAARVDRHVVYTRHPDGSVTSTTA